MINLTERELDIIKLLAFGKSNNEISDELFISVHTVKMNLENIYDKTGYHNRMQVVIFALKNKVIELPPI